MAKILWLFILIILLKHKHTLNTIKIQYFMSICFFDIFLVHVFFHIINVALQQFRNPSNLKQTLRTFSFCFFFGLSENCHFYSNYSNFWYRQSPFFSSLQLLSYQGAASKFSPIEFGVKKSLCFIVAFKSLIFMNLGTLKNQIIKFQISLTELKK